MTYYKVRISTFERTFLPYAIVSFTSVIYFPSDVSKVPKYLKLLTWFNFVPFAYYMVHPGLGRVLAFEITITTVFLMIKLSPFSSVLLNDRIK